MSKPLWQQLTDLVNSGQELSALQHQRETLTNQIAEKRVAIAALATQLEAKREHKKTLRKRIDELELKSAELDAQEKAKKAVFEQITGQKEVAALEKELAVLAATQGDHEESLVAAWQAHESAEKELASLEGVLVEQVEAHEQEIITLDKQLKALDTQEVEFNATQAESIAALPELWQTRYEQMKDRIENPIVPLIDSSCSQCFYLVLPKDLTRIRKGDVLPCRSCYRYLYYVEPKAEEAPAEPAEAAEAEPTPAPKEAAEGEES